MNSIRMTTEQSKLLHNYLLSSKDKESAAFLTAGFFENDTGCHFTVRNILIPKDDDYSFRSGNHLEMSPMFFNRAISMAERDHITVIQCHSHPFSVHDLQYSPSDFMGESMSSKTVNECLGGKPMGSMLFGQKNIIGRIWLLRDKPTTVDQIRIVGRHMQIRYTGKKTRVNLDTELFDRQIRAFGTEGQEMLSGLKVGIVGVGGTGSAVAEQLAREGIRKFILVDHDRFSKSNKTRMYGSYADTEKRYKVDIVTDNIRKIEPESTIKSISKDVISQEVLDHMKNCDVVFSCTDRHAPRSVLNELAYQFFIPVIDLGVGIDTKNEKITGGSVRVSLSSPSMPCLYCTEVINSERVLAESLGEKDRESRQQRGYIQGMEDDVPSVIVFTTMAASYAVFLLKDMFFHISESDAGMLHIDIRSLTTSRLSSKTRNNCVCGTRLGKGEYVPLSTPSGNQDAHYGNTDTTDDSMEEEVTVGHLISKVISWFNTSKSRKHKA